jgi:hypothetical protein
MAQTRTRTSSPRRAAPSNTNSRPARRSGGVKPQAAASAPRRSSEPGRVPRKRPQAARKADRASASARSSKADGRPGRASAIKRSARASGSGSARASRSSSARASGSGSNGRHGPHTAGAVPEAAEAAAQAAKRRVGAAVNGAGRLGNVKAPLIASGAALAGVAGGWALSGARERVPGMKGNGGRRIHLDSKDISQTAKQIGAFTEQLGNLAAEIRRTRESAGAEARRSPIEVVLQGLTARR